MKFPVQPTASAARSETPRAGCPCPDITDYLRTTRLSRLLRVSSSGSILSIGLPTSAMCDFSEYRGNSEEWLAVEPNVTKNATPSSIDEIISLRDAVNKGREEEASRAMGTLGDSIATKDFSIPTREGQQLAARTYKARQASEALPLYVHLHGGGFLFGSLSSQDATCARIALDGQVLVLNVCYRHKPEHTYPTAWNDVEDAFRWLEANAIRSRSSSAAYLPVPG